MNKEEKFNTIIIENNGHIKRICRYYFDNPEDQKDIYQEVMVNIWKSLDSFRGDSSIGTWVYRVTVNTALTFTGKAYKNMKLIVNGNLQNFMDMLDEVELKQKLVQERLLEILQTELNLLPVIDKALISLLLEGLTMK